MPNPYTEALDGLRDAVAQRARRYKRLVITVALGSITCVAAAAWWGRGWPLTPLLWLPTLVLGFHALDLRTVLHWRNRAVSGWADGELRIDLLRRTASQMPHLPPQTLAGMLDCLPAWSGDAPDLPARAALASVQSQLGAAAELRLWLRAAAWALAAALVVTAAWRGTPVPLIACASLPLLSYGGRSWSRRHTHRLTVQVWKAVRGTDSDRDPAAWIRGLSTVGLPAAWLEAVVSSD